MNSRFLSLYGDKHEYGTNKVPGYASVKMAFWNVGKFVSQTGLPLKRAVGKMKPTGQLPF